MIIHSHPTSNQGNAMATRGNVIAHMNVMGARGNQWQYDGHPTSINGNAMGVCGNPLSSMAISRATMGNPWPPEGMS